MITAERDVNDVALCSEDYCTDPPKIRPSLCRWGLITRATVSDFRQDSKLYRHANILDMGNNLNTKLSHELCGAIAHGMALGCRHVKSLAKIS